MKLDFSKNIIHVNQIDSTNDYAIEQIKDPSFRLPSVIYSDYQSRGKGQYGKEWHSESGKNLLCSLVLNNSFDINDQLLDVGLRNVLLKWPNDILINSKKIAGILINNKISDQRIKYSILGLGLNINQVSFPKFEREATSIINEVDCLYDVKLILDNLITAFQNRYTQNHDNLIEDYTNTLYMRGEVVRLSKEGVEFEGVIKSIKRSGSLIVNVNNQDFSFLSSEIKFID